MKNLYYVSFTYYNDFYDEDKDIGAFVIASSAIKAAKKATEGFAKVDTINVKTVCLADNDEDIKCVYVPADNKVLIDEVIRSNGY